MAKKKGSSGGSGSGRAYASDVVKAAAHPTRQAILKALERGDQTTVELEKVTGENRYHLYHHLAVLEDTGLVASRVEGKAKRFSLKKPKKPEAVYLELDRADPEESQKLMSLLDAVKDITGDEVPKLKKVTRARLMLSYPWSEEEDS